MIAPVFCAPVVSTAVADALAVKWLALVTAEGHRGEVAKAEAARSASRPASSRPCAGCGTGTKRASGQCRDCDRKAAGAAMRPALLRVMAPGIDYAPQDVVEALAAEGFRTSPSAVSYIASDLIVSRRVNGTRRRCTLWRRA